MGKWLCAAFIGLLYCPLLFAQSINQSLFSVPELQNQTRFDWKISTKSQYFENRFNQDTIFSAAPGLKLQHNFTRSFWALTEAEFYFESGNRQGLEREDGKSENSIYLQQALFHFEPAKWINLKLGALNQRFLESDMLISPRAFPGLKQELSFSGNIVSLRLFAQQVVPTSTSLSTKAVDKEPLPSLLTETAILSAKLNSSNKIKVRATYFSFKDLPSQIAEESRMFGNTVIRTSQKKSIFEYNFQGFESGGTYSLRWSRYFSQDLSGSMIRNLEAEKGRNGANIYKIENHIDFMLHHRLSFGAESFIIQSDASPAFYNSWKYGHNNRKGYGASISWLHKKHNLEVRAEFINSNPIEQFELQDNNKLYLIQLETFYDDK